MSGGTEIDPQIIAEWRVFFGMSAGTAAGLAGLVFVALSMHLKGIRAHPPYKYRAGSSLSSMMVVFIVSSLVLFPRQTSRWLGLEELVVVGAECVFLAWTFLQTREAVAKLPQGLANLRPYQVRTALAVAVGLVGTSGGALVWAGLEAGFFVLAAFCAVTMVWVVINTWALVIGIPEEDGSKGSSEAK